MNSIIKVVLVLLCAINSYFALTSAPFAYPRLLILGLTGVDQSENDCLDGVIQEEIDELKKVAFYYPFLLSFSIIINCSLIK